MKMMDRARFNEVKFQKHTRTLVVGARLERNRAEEFKEVLRANGINFQTVLNLWVDDFLAELKGEVR